VSIERAIAIKRINLLDVLIEQAEARAYWSTGKSALKVLETWGLLRGTSS